MLTITYFSRHRHHFSLLFLLSPMWPLSTLQLLLRAQLLPLLCHHFQQHLPLQTPMLQLQLQLYHHSSQPFLQTLLMHLCLSPFLLHLHQPVLKDHCSHHFMWALLLLLCLPPFLPLLLQPLCNHHCSHHFMWPPLMLPHLCLHLHLFLLLQLQLLLLNHHCSHHFM